mmetsp:Transcript_39670/g.78129  ORF Transcript_39670/g.78129 Transcript_39670/m.78129 type:complete len:206 (+) Transcript_39670:220-837(+)
MLFMLSRLQQRLPKKRHRPLLVPRPRTERTPHTKGTGTDLQYTEVVRLIFFVCEIEKPKSRLVRPSRRPPSHKVSEGGPHGVQLPNAFLYFLETVELFLKEGDMTDRSVESLKLIACTLPQLLKRHSEHPEAISQRREVQGRLSVAVFRVQIRSPLDQQLCCFDRVIPDSEEERCLARDAGGFYVDPGGDKILHLLGVTQPTGGI